MQTLAIPFRLAKGWKHTIQRWEFWYDPKWRRSSLLSVAMWLAGTKVIFYFAHWGPGWAVIFSVGLLADALTWTLKKVIVWARRSVAVHASIGKNWALWLLFAGVNFVLTLTLNTAGDLNTQYTRWVMIPFGILVNPVRYHLDNRVVFGDMSLPQLSRIVWNRTEREATFAYLNFRGWTGTL